MGIRKIIFNSKQLFKRVGNVMLRITNTLMFLGSMLVALVIVFDIGFQNSSTFSNILEEFFLLMLVGFAIAYLLKLVLTIRVKKSVLTLCLELLIPLFACIVLAFKHNLFYNADGEVFKILKDIILSKYFTYVLFVCIIIIEISKNLLSFYNIRSNPYKIFIYSYILLILLGTGMLLLPNATVSGIGIIDALFTSTSAVCVTGLIVVDTATHFTELGKIIILILLQLGGVGVMTFTSFFVLFSDNTFSYQNQIFLKSVVNNDDIGQVVKTVVKIVLFTLSFEMIGAFLIYINLNSTVYFPSIQSKAFYSVFHSASAFCNAGFSTTTDGLYHVSTRFNYNIHLIISFLIIFGGLGFPIVFNYYKFLKFKIRNFFRHYLLKENYHHFPRLINVNTKIVIYTTIGLIIFGFITYFIAEYNNTLKGLSVYGKVVTAFFGSVTPRTAGFNTVNMTSLSFPFIMICMFLMWVGASPNSTGGGIKTSTFALAFLNIISIGKGKDRVEIYHRRISDASLRAAFAVLMLSVLVIGICVFIIALVEKDLAILDIIFECVSAFSTVGLSMGITGALTESSKLVLVLAMFVGRVGTLTFFLAFVRKIKTLNYQYPSENIVI